MHLIKFWHIIMYVKMHWYFKMHFEMQKKKKSASWYKCNRVYTGNNQEIIHDSAKNKRCYIHSDGQRVAAVGTNTTTCMVCRMTKANWKEKVKYFSTVPEVSYYVKVANSYLWIFYEKGTLNTRLTSNPLPCPTYPTLKMLFTSICSAPFTLNHYTISSYCFFYQIPLGSI